MTKVDPPNPMKKRSTESDAELFTRPVNAQGMEAKARMIPMGIRAPYLSHNGPFTKRKKIVPATEQILLVQTCCFVKPSVSFTSGSRGAMANQMKKAMKKQNQLQWNARICGRLKDRSLISVALSSWFGSTFT